MRKGELNTRILKLAIPFVFANISVPLLGLVDTMMMGHMDSHYYLGAIALGSLIFNFVFWGFGFLKMGTTGFTAQAHGRRSLTEVTLVLYRGALIAIIIGIAVILLQHAIWKVSEFLLMGSNEVMTYAGQYFFIRIYSAPAVFLLYVLVGWMLGVQNAMFVLYIMLVENMSNILFNILFVYGFGMRSDGVALGTVCAQYLALGFALVLLSYSYKEYLQKVKFASILHKEAFLLFLKANGNIMVRTVTLMFVFAFFMNQSSSVNDTVLAANMILLQFVTLFAYFTDAFAHAGETLAGFFIGARKIKAFKLLIYRLLIWAFILSALFSTLYGFGFSFILQMMTSQVEVIKMAHEYKYWLIAMPILSFIAYIWDGIYIGITQTAKLRNSMLLAAFAVFIPSFYIFLPIISNHALWLSMALFMVARGVILSIYANQIIRKL